MIKTIFKSVLMFLVSLNAMATTNSSFTGYVIKYKNEAYASTNFNFSYEGIRYTVENFSGIQTFKILNNNLYIELKNQSPVKIGELDLEVGSIKNNEKLPFKIIENLEVEALYFNKKRPKVARVLSCGITGCGFEKSETIRTQIVFSLKFDNGSKFCFYQNRPNRENGVLYPEECLIK